MKKSTWKSKHSLLIIHMVSRKKLQSPTVCHVGNALHTYQVPQLIHTAHCREMVIYLMVTRMTDGCCRLLLPSPWSQYLLCTEAKEKDKNPKFRVMLPLLIYSFVTVMKSKCLTVTVISQGSSEC